MAQQTFSKDVIPQDGIVVSAPAGKVLTRVHLDLGPDGITLSSVGAASTVLSQGNRHHLTLKPGTDGVTLSMVGAASAPKS